MGWVPRKSRPPHLLKETIVPVAYLFDVDGTLTPSRQKMDQTLKNGLLISLTITM